MSTSCPSLPAAAAAGFPVRERWWELAQLRAFVGPEATLLGYDAGPQTARPEYAFLAADVSRACGRPAQRMTALLRLADRFAAVVFDLGAVEPASPSAADLSIARIRLPRTLGESVSLRVIQPAGGAVEWRPVDSLDLAGVRLADRAVLFHLEPVSALSAVSFSVEGTGTLKYLAGGLAPGMWDIWRNGWLEETMGGVNPRSGALYFEARPGSYFLRRRN